MKKLLLAVFVCLFELGITFGQLSFTENVLTSSEQNVSGLIIADLNNDNSNDIVCSSINKEIVWWKNNQNTSFGTKKNIDNSFNGGMYLHVADINNDGFKDVVASGAGTDGGSVVWYKSNGTDFESWERIPITNYFYYSHGVFAGDIDNDGDLDVVSASAQLGKIAWFENTASNGDGSSWTQHGIISNFPASQAVCLADVNKDGNLDVIGASCDNNIIVCFINDGSGTDWSQQVTVDNQIQLPHWLGTLDFDNDGDTDIYATGYLSGEISWYENDMENSSWIKHKVITNFSYTLAVSAGDLDKDGDIDFIGTTAGGSKVVSFENKGDNLNFTRKTIGYSYAGAWPVSIGDLNNDGYLDAVAGANSTGKVAWFKNNLTTTSQPFLRDTNQSLNVFPVPNSGCFKATVENDFIGEATARIICISGQTVYSEEISKNQKTLNLDFRNLDLPQGLYLLNIKCGNDFLTKRFEVIR
ncbi:MAG TPA: FG-GAP-like repeat-containing protein [Tenuifilaceae bacterium]|nr:FG-GAP-like repeat-containing protein [Tenuifilaceae bacterium]HPJ45554.1 FG-GAP-like repeat-containing protein [Tenuifilaceae bacterium]